MNLEEMKPYKRKQGVKIIAIDFDGCMVDEAFPEVGKLKDGARKTIADLYDAGYELILWTCRTNDGFTDGTGKRHDGTYLQHATAFLRTEGLMKYFRRVNDNIDFRNTSKKVYAHCYIDDRNIGGFVGWKKVRKELLL